MRTTLAHFAPFAALLAVPAPTFAQSADEKVNMVIIYGDDACTESTEDVTTICVGQCASMGALLLAAGAKGKRFALPNSRILIHQPSGGSQGQATDIRIQAEEILRMRELTSQIIAKHTGQTYDTVERDVERDKIMSAMQAKEYGLIDEVIAHRE